MQTSLTITALFAAFGQSAIAATTTSSIRASEIVATSRLTTSTAPAATSSCGASPDTCPSCDGQTISDVMGTTYLVHCDSIITSTEDFKVTNVAAVNTTRQCLEACDEFEGCLGASWLPQNTCVLATGSFQGIAQRSGYDAYVKQAIGTSTSSESSAVTATSGTASHSSHPISTSYASISAPGRSANCNFANISCPDCDGSKVTDTNGKTYKVYCDYMLFSDDNYSLQKWTTPEGCLLECDKYSWCEGATFWPQGNCELAKPPASDVAPLEMPGYTAFLPATASTSNATSTSRGRPSAYPTNNGYTPVAKVVSSSSTTTKSSSAQTTSSCNLDAARCPACDSVSVVDWLNQTWTMSCNEVPICESVVNRANETLQFECLEYCDADPTCFAATWEDGSCNLCEGALDGTAFDARGLRGPNVIYYSASYGPRSTTASSSRDSMLATATPVANSTSSFSRPRHHGNTFITAPAPSNTSTAVGITGTVSAFVAANTTTITDYSVSSTSSLSVLQMDGNTFETAAAPSSSQSVVSITGTVTQLSAAGPTNATASTTSSASFVPPLTGGVVSYATPGGETMVG